MQCCGIVVSAQAIVLPMRPVQRLIIDLSAQHVLAAEVAFAELQ